MDTQDSYLGDEAIAGARGADQGQTAQFEAIQADTPLGDYEGDTGAATADVKGAVQDTLQQVQDTAGSVVGQAGDTVGTVVDQVRQTAATRLEDSKGRAAEGISGVADAVRQVSRDIPSEGPVADYMDRAAWQLERFSGYLREKDVRELTVEIEHFARRQPTLFLAGGFLLGLLGARFLKSSASQAQSAQAGQRAQFNAGQAGREKTELVTFTTRGNYTVEGQAAGYPGDGGAGDDDGTTIRSTYMVTTPDDTSSEG